MRYGERDMAKMSKRLQSGGLFETSVSGRRRLGARNHSKTSKRLQRGARFQNRLKNNAFCEVFAPVAASISRKRANGCRVVRFLKIPRRSHQDSDAIGQDVGKMAQHAPR